MIRRRFGRAASTLAYGLIVGLIAVVAIASVSGTSSSLERLFGTASDRISGAVPARLTWSGPATVSVTGPGSPALGTPVVYLLINAGRRASRPVSVSLTGSTATLTANDCTGRSLAGGESCSVSLRPQASMAGTSSVSLSAGDGESSAALAVTVSASGFVPPSLSLLDTDGSFTVTGPGSPAYGTARSFRLRNPGDSPTGTLSVSLTGNTTNFAITADGCQGQSLGPMAECSITIRPQASSGGSFPAGTVTFSASPGGSTSLALSGSGSGWGASTGSFLRQGLWDYGSCAGEDRNVCPGGLQTNPQTYYNIPEPACSSGLSTCTVVLVEDGCIKAYYNWNCQ